MFDRRIAFGSHSTRVVMARNHMVNVGALLREETADGPVRSVVVLSDSAVGPLYASGVQESLDKSGFHTIGHEIEAGESSKNLDSARILYESLAEHEVTRDDVLLALGGGVVSDLGGFVAATWMRGIRFAVCPTTLESQVDACIGGKTAVNIAGGKNLVGAFHHPLLVIVDPTCLRTLGERDMRAGLAESIKHAMISSSEFLLWHETNMDRIRDGDEAVLGNLIARNLEIKAGVVESDPEERSDRRIMLNFGHTVGHAIEECSGYALRHGECVALGMLAACRLSNALEFLDRPVTDRLAALLEHTGLPTKLPEPIESDRILATIRKDKKVRTKTPRFVLLEDVGRPVLRENIAESLVRDAYESLLP